MLSSPKGSLFPALGCLLSVLFLAAPASASSVVAPEAPGGETLPELSTGPAAIAHLVSLVRRDGETAVLRGDQAGFAGVEDPTTFKVLHFPEGTDGMTHSVFTAGRLEEGELEILLFVTRRVEKRVEEWRYIRATMEGKFLQATAVRDRLDREGILRAGGRRIEGITGKKGQDLLDHEIDYHFRGKYRRR